MMMGSIHANATSNPFKTEVYKKVNLIQNKKPAVK